MQVIMMPLFYRHAVNVQIFLKMCRSDYAEKQLKIMQQADEDHTLTQLANAWWSLAVVIIIQYLPPFLLLSPSLFVVTVLQLI